MRVHLLLGGTDTQYLACGAKDIRDGNAASDWPRLLRVKLDNFLCKRCERCYAKIQRNKVTR